MSLRSIFLALALGASMAPAMAGELALDLNGHSWHGEKPTAFPAHDWTENNRGLGIQYRTAITDGVRQRYLVGTMVDSLGVNGSYAGATYEWVWDRGSMRYSAGGMLSLLNRTLKFNQQGRELLLVPLPAVSVEYLPLGLSLNATFVPGMNFHQERLPPVLFVNLSLKLADF